MKLHFINPDTGYRKLNFTKISKLPSFMSLAGADNERCSRIDNFERWSFRFFHHNKQYTNSCTQSRWNISSNNDVTERNLFRSHQYQQNRQSSVQYHRRCINHSGDYVDSRSRIFLHPTRPVSELHSSV